MSDLFPIVTYTVSSTPRKSIYSWHALRIDSCQRKRRLQCKIVLQVNNQTNSEFICYVWKCDLRLNIAWHLQIQLKTISISHEGWIIWSHEGESTSQNTHICISEGSILNIDPLYPLNFVNRSSIPVKFCFVSYSLRLGMCSLVVVIRLKNYFLSLKANEVRVSWFCFVSKWLPSAI